MITGMVNADYEAMIRLKVQGPIDQELEIDAVIDTGFNGFLTLPPTVIATLGLSHLSQGRGLLANGSEELFDIYGVNLLWDDQMRYVEVGAVDTTPLVGMSLLDGYDLYVQVMAGGHVSIQMSS